jgi:uncharacterized membrane protein
LLSLLLNSGLLNPAFLAAVLAAVCLAVGRPTRAPRWLGWVAVVTLGLASAASLGFGLYRSYTVPRDVMQDIVAAEEFAAGRPMQPPDMNAKMAEAIDREGPRKSLLWWSDTLTAQEREQRQAMRTEHWVQAHPPFVTVLTAPLVTSFGVLGTQAAYTLAALLGLAVTVGLIYWKFGFERWQTVGLLAVAAVVGWGAVVSAVRLQQLSLPLVGLLTVGWALLRRGNDVPAGVCVGLAVCLKFVPGVLLLPLMARHRRAFAAAVGTGGLVTLFVVVAVPWSDLVAYRATSSGVIDQYAGYHANLSWLGAFARCAYSTGVVPLSWAEGAWVFSIGAVGLAWAYLLFHHPQPWCGRRQSVDAEFALGLSLIPLLSPVAWDHYQVFLLLPAAVLAEHVRRTGGLRNRLLLGLVLVGLAVPDSLVLWLDGLLKPPLRWVAVWVVLPFRTVVMTALAGWVGVLSWQRTSRVLTARPLPPAYLGPGPAGRLFAQ